MTASTVTRPAPWSVHHGPALPALDMMGTHHGVTLSDIGDDGDVVALGHVGAYRLLAALLRHARQQWGVPLYDRPTLLADAVDQVSHGWAVNVGAGTGGYGWCLESAGPETPGAFPVTRWMR